LILAFDRDDVALLTKRSGQAEPRKSPQFCSLRSPPCGCGDSYTKRKFPPHKVYRRDDRGIVGVETFG
jgi:hypothetical protein